MFRSVRNQTLFGLLILLVYVIAFSAASFHSHSDSSEHLTCKLCHFVSMSGITQRGGSLLPLLISEQSFIISKLSFPVFFLLHTFNERGPPSFV
jgi:hypothetical protein